jgi:glutamate 5-kinase
MQSRIGRMQIADLHNAGHEIILVSSGAVAEGMVRMKLRVDPPIYPACKLVLLLVKWA